MKRLLILGGLALAFVLGAAAVALNGGLPFSQPAAAADGNRPKAQKVMTVALDIVENGERTSGTVDITFVDPDFLPGTAEDAFGLYLGRDGNTLTLGSGSIEVTLDVEVINDEPPVTTVHADHSGPQTTVVVTDATALYVDTTPHPEIGPEALAAGPLTITRTLEPVATLDGLGDNMVVRAWGSVQDGQLVADTLVYEPIR